MSLVPHEYLGMARAWRGAALERADRGTDAMQRIAVSLRGQRRLGQVPSPGAYAKIVATWRKQVSAASRLGLSATAAPRRLSIMEARVTPGKFRFDGWDEDDVETAIIVMRIALTVSIEEFRFETIIAASVPLHALARRFQRGWDNSDTAIRADLHALAEPCEGTLAAGGEFAVPIAHGGKWVGVVTEIKDRGDTVRVLVVRTFRDAGMAARTGHGHKPENSGRSCFPPDRTASPSRTTV
jgi:hypothetical protein